MKQSDSGRKARRRLGTFLIVITGTALGALCGGDVKAEAAVTVAGAACLFIGYYLLPGKRQ